MSSHYVLALRSNSIVICRKDLGLLVASIMVPWSHFAKNTGGAIITCFFLSLSISLFVVCSSDCHLIDSLICFFIQFIKQLFCKLAVWLSLVTVMLRVWSVYSRMLHVAALQLSIWYVSWVSTSCVSLCTVQLTVNLCEAWSLQWPYTDPESWDEVIKLHYSVSIVFNAVHEIHALNNKINSNNALTKEANSFRIWACVSCNSVNVDRV